MSFCSLKIKSSGFQFFFSPGFQRSGRLIVFQDNANAYVNHTLYLCPNGLPTFSCDYSYFKKYQYYEV